MLLDCEYCAESAGCRYILAQEESECPYRKLVKDRETVRLVNRMRSQSSVYDNIHHAGDAEEREEVREDVEKQDEKMLEMGGTVYVWKLLGLARLIDKFPTADVGRYGNMYMVRLSE